MKYPKAYRLSYIETCTQSLILFGFGVYFCLIVFSGTVYRFVHERHIPLLLISALCFFIIGTVQLLHGIRHPHRHTRGFFSPGVFAAALIVMIITTGQEIRFSQFSHTDSAAGPNTAPFIPIPTEQPLSLEEGSIRMTEENFGPWLAELYANLDTWEGTPITLSGFVWKDAELFAPDEFALARMMMICCAADMQPVGILAQWNGAESVTEDEWIELTGTVAKKSYPDGFDPLIIVRTLKKAARPQREYIYP